MSPIQHGFAPANVDLSPLEADQSFFNDAFSLNVSSSPLNPESVVSLSSFVGGPAVTLSAPPAITSPFTAPDCYPLTTRQHSPLFKPGEHSFEHSTYDATDSFLPTLENFTSDADPETPPGLVVPPSTATAAAAIDPLCLAMPPSSFEFPSVAWAPSTPSSFVPAAFAPVSFAPGQNLSVTPSTTTPGDDFANSQRPSDDVGLSKGWDLNSLASIPSEVNDVDTYAPLNFGTTQFPVMEPLPTLPILAAAPAPRHHPNSRQTAKTIAEKVTPGVTAKVNRVPAKRKPGRPRLPEGAPKAPYKKRNVPAPPPTTSAKPKRAYKKRTAVTVD